MSIILGSGDALKDLPIGNKKISKVVVGNKVVWQKKWPGLKFTSNQDNSTVGYTIRDTVNKDIYTSTDGKTWTAWNGSNITLNNGESIYVWNKTNTLSRSGSKYLRFTMSGSIAASGNCDSMIDFGDLSPWCYHSLFNNCTALTTAPELPATQLAVNCYTNMFRNCTSLTKAPDLPSTTLAYYCYSNMFGACTSLTTTPELPATILSKRCYTYMFSGCTALTTAPDLPATTLAEECYTYMFSGCSSLTTAPDLPATTLVDYCYQRMFYNCSSLNNIKLSYTGNFDARYFSVWVGSILSTGTLYYNGSDTTRGESAIPQNWTIQRF